MRKNVIYFVFRSFLGLAMVHTTWAIADEEANSQHELLTPITEDSSLFQLLPTPNKLPITTGSFCSGVQNVLKTTKQAIKEQTDLLCAGANPTPLLQNLISAPYQGVGTPNPTSIRVQVVPGNDQQTELLVAFAMRVPLTAVKTLLGEEKHAIVPYDSGNDVQDPMRMSFKFLEPPKNTGDCDTSFTLEQLVQVRTVIAFDDTSQHELKLYLLQPDNWDFFLAGRTLVRETNQFKKSVVVRGFMTDPQDPNKTLSITVLNFVMNNRNQHERMTAAFMNFIRADMQALYNEQAN